MVVSMVRRKDAVRVLVAACALAWPAVVLADGAPVVTHAPEIQGTPVVGQTLHAANATWTGSPDAAPNYSWLRCPDADLEDCSTIPGATGDTYTLIGPDAGNMMRVTLEVSLGDDSDHKTSDPTAVVQTGTPATVMPVPATVSPAPAPGAPAAAPVSPSALPAGIKLITPKPVVRIAGHYSKRGARLTRLTVKAPKGTTVKVACTGKHCPSKAQSLKAGRTAHATKYERHTLATGTRLTVTVSRKGYASRVTTFTVRARKAPKRSDGCLAPGQTKTQRC